MFSHVFPPTLFILLLLSLLFFVFCCTLLGPVITQESCVSRFSGCIHSIFEMALASIRRLSLVPCIVIRSFPIIFFLNGRTFCMRPDDGGSSFFCLDKEFC